MQFGNTRHEYPLLRSVHLVQDHGKEGLWRIGGFLEVRDSFLFTFLFFVCGGKHGALYTSKGLCQ